MKVTWITVDGTFQDLKHCQAWIKANKTMWVIESNPKTDIDKFDPRKHIKGFSGQRTFIPSPDMPIIQRFGFRCANDALMFKLSMGFL